MAKTEMIKTWAIRAVALSLLGLSVWSYIVVQTDWLKPNPPAKPPDMRPRIYSTEYDTTEQGIRRLILVVDPKRRGYDFEKELQARIQSEFGDERNCSVMIYDDLAVAQALRDVWNDHPAVLKPEKIKAHLVGSLLKIERTGPGWDSQFWW